MDKCLVLSPSNDALVDCFLDALGFLQLRGLLGSPLAHSHTGSVILAYYCPVLLTSCLQTEIALSTVEVEYVGLSTASKDLSPIIDVICSLSSAVGISVLLKLISISRCVRTMLELLPLLALSLAP